MSHSYLRAPAAPNLPLGPGQWDARYQDQFANVLRLYFNQLSSNLQELESPAGGNHLGFPCASVQRTTDLTMTANTPTLVTLNQNDFLNAVRNPGTDGLIVEKTGVYNYQFSIQLANTDTQIHTAYVWLRVNGTDLTGTGSKFDCPAKHGTSDGYLIAACNFYVELNAGDYVSLYAAVTNAALYMEAYAAQTSPFAMPSIPSVVATLSFVSAPIA